MMLELMLVLSAYLFSIDIYGLITSRNMLLHMWKQLLDWLLCHQFTIIENQLIYDTCIGCTQCVHSCSIVVLEMIPWGRCKTKQIASATRIEDCVSCKICESASPTNY
ncbi:hypothetical protein M9H77_30683 [Catharanthus roseus]|uniref:Uncharacterized protein n=1 Tax=Catharanthus roseus TaxID=4058 RepID=A0ACB9ZYV5_CATRO|nr:hypothetical protein M9H77_30683 [Catharanthus roseus]